MKPLLILLKAQLLQFLQSSGKKKRRSAFLTILLMMLLMIYFFGISSVKLFAQLSSDQYAMGLFTLLMMNSSFLTLMGLSWASGVLFGFRDYDMLMSLPLKQEQIVAGKLLSFFVLEYLYSLPLVLPAVAVYACFAHPPFLSYIWMIVGFFALPVLPAVLAILGGSLINSLTVGKKHESLWRGLSNIILMLVFAGFSTWNSGAGAQKIFSVSSVMKYGFPISGLYGKAIVSGNGFYIVTEIVAAFGLLALVLRSLSGLVLRLSAKGNQGYHVQNFRLKQARENSVLAALIKRERKMMLADIVGLFNMCFGVLILSGLGIYTILFPSKSPVFPFIQKMGVADGGRFVILTAGMLLMTINLPCVSISLEGKNLWILRSLPIKEEEIFCSKIVCPFTVLVAPCLFVIGVALWRLGVPISMISAGMAYMLAAWVMMALFGLIVNLLFPKLDWDRSIIVYKRSLSAFIGTFSGVLLGAVTLGVGEMWGNTNMYLLILLVVACLFSLVFYQILRRWGVRRFRSLI